MAPTGNWVTRATWTTFLLVASVLALLPVVHAESSSVITLTAATFDKSVASGTWFVDFFAPWCTHCKQLAPKYEEMAATVAPWRKSKQFYVAKVDCVDNEALCRRHEVDEYPTLHLFHDGHRTDEYKGDRTTKALLDYVTTATAKIEVNAAKAAAQAADSVLNDSPHEVHQGGKHAVHDFPSEAHSAALDAALAAKAEEFQTVAADRAARTSAWGQYGRVVELTGDNFEEMTSKSGPWLVMFYAAWSKQSQAFLPIYEAVGRKLAGKMNVGRINADIEVELATRFFVRGYPTIKLVRRGIARDYRGPRTQDALLEFAHAALIPRPVQMVTAAEFHRMRAEHDVAVVLAMDAHTTPEAMRTFLDSADTWSVGGTTGLFASADPGITPGERPAILVARRGFPETDRFPPVAPADRPADEYKPGPQKAFVLPDGEDVVDELEQEARERAKREQAQRFAFTVPRIVEFVRARRYPLVPELTAATALELMDGVDLDGPRARRVVVVGVLDPAHSDAERDILHRLAESLVHQGLQMHGVDVRFVWLNGAQYAAYAQRMFDVTPADLPRVVLAVPAKDMVYRMNPDGKPLAFKTAEIAKALDDVAHQVATRERGQYRGTYVPGSRAQRGEWLVAAAGGDMIGPIAAAVVGVLGLGAVGWWVWRATTEQSVSTATGDYRHVAAHKDD
ncbi:hypothetical protein GGF31_006494 [Allomyces arbusculus]|nr:hypothetical protein GGF31_006494 [Allomyces arbusculus]